MQFDRNNLILTIRFSPLVLLLIFAPIGVLVVISVAVNPDAWLQASIWVYLVFVTLGLGLLFGCLIMPARYYLRLTPEGLTINYLFRRCLYKWTEIDNFRVLDRKMDGGTQLPLIVFDLTGASPNKTALMRVTSTFNHYDVSVMATFDRSADAIVSFLKLYKDKFGKCEPPTAELKRTPEP